MHIENTFIEGLLVITPSVFADDRGYFFESYNKKSLAQYLEIEFVQDNESSSKKNVLRGLHFQSPPYAQGKLVRVIKGSVLDVVVDLRKNSETYGKHYKHILSGEHKEQLYVPEGLAHGFLVLEDDTVFSYKCTHFYNKEADKTLLWCDKTLNINWQIENPIVSEKDENGQEFATFVSPF